MLRMRTHLTVTHAIYATIKTFTFFLAQLHQPATTTSQQLIDIRLAQHWHRRATL